MSSSDLQRANDVSPSELNDEVPDGDGREKAIKRDNGLCQICGNNRIQVHHVTLKGMGKTPDYYDTADNLLCLCVDHHSDIHSGSVNILEFDPDENILSVCDDTGVLLDNLWFYDRPDKNSDLAFEFHSRVLGLRSVIMRSFCELGKYLYEMQDNELYKSLGYNTMKQYLGDPDVSMSYDTARRLMRIYESHILEENSSRKEIVEMGIAKADMINRYSGTDKYDEAKQYALGSSRSDLKKQIDEWDGNEQDDSDLNPTFDLVEKLQRQVKLLENQPSNKELWDDVKTMAESALRRV